MVQDMYKDQITINPKTITLNLWIIIVTIPELADLTFIYNVPLDVLFSTSIGIWLHLKYGLPKINALKFCVLITLLFVLFNEGVYQSLLSFLLIFPIFWVEKIVHRIKFSTRILIFLLASISIIDILINGGVEFSNWRLPCKLILLLIIVRNKILQLLFITASGFRSLLLIPFRKFILLATPLYLLLMFKDEAWLSRVLWNVDRYQYIRPLGLGYMHSSSGLNFEYRRSQLAYDRFNQTLSVMDFGYVDLFIKFGVVLGTMYLLIFVYHGIKILGYKILISLLLINITFGILSHESLLWETFFVLEYYRKYGIDKSKKFKFLSS